MRKVAQVYFFRHGKKTMGSLQVQSMSYHRHFPLIIQELGPTLGMFINAAKCELYSLNGILSMFPSQMEISNVPHFEILGALIGDAKFYAKVVSEKCTMASKMLTQLEEVSSVDPQVDLLLLRQCGGFCKLVHMARSTLPFLVVESFKYFDLDVRHCFALCTGVDTSNSAWKQAQLSLAEVVSGCEVSPIIQQLVTSLH